MDIRTLIEQDPQAVSDLLASGGTPNLGAGQAELARQALGGRAAQLDALERQAMGATPMAPPVAPRVIVAPAASTVNPLTLLIEKLVETMAPKKPTQKK